MGKIAFVFSGQGGQYGGMGRKLYDCSSAAKKIFDMADGIRPGTSSQCFLGSKEELSVTINTQPCLYCVDLAAAEALKAAGVLPDAVAGFSLGEIAALAFAGVYGHEDGFRLVIKRAEAMHVAAEKTDGAMAAILKLPNETVIGLCEQVTNVYPVNFNCPGQLVCAGKKEYLAKLCQAAQQAGGRAVRLAVSGGFHSPLMNDAARALRRFLEGFELLQPRIPVYSNVTARPYGADAGQMRELIALQVNSPVLWQSTIENMIKDGVDTFVEVGAGWTLCGIIKKIDQTVDIYNVEDDESLAATLEALGKGK